MEYGDDFEANIVQPFACVHSQPIIVFSPCYLIIPIPLAKQRLSHFKPHNKLHHESINVIT